MNYMYLLHQLEDKIELELRRQQIYGEHDFLVMFGRGDGEGLYEIFTDTVIDGKRFSTGIYVDEHTFLRAVNIPGLRHISTINLKKDSE